MSATDSESADTEADTDSEEEFEYYPQVTQHPTTIIEGEVVDIVTGADIDSGVEQTGSSFGVVFEQPEVADGTLWQNRNVPDGFDSTSEYNDTIRMAQADDDTDYIRGREVTDEAIEAAQERLDEADIDYEGEDYDSLKVKGTDFKVADTDDRDAEVQSVVFDGEEKVTGIDVGGGSFNSEQVDAFDVDRIMVWYGGMSGQFVGRGLDFNGMPFSRYTDDGYLVKGLFQVPIGWRGDADVEQYDNVPTTNRKELATDLNRAPRVIRPPVLRDDIDGRAFIGIGRYNGGNMYEVQMGRAQDDYGDVFTDDADFDELSMQYSQEADEVLAEAFDDPASVFALYHGEGWQPEPDNAQPFGDGDSEGGDGGSFDVGVADDETAGLTDAEQSFADTISEKIAGRDIHLDDEVFDVGDGEKGDLAALVEHNAGAFDTDDPNVDGIRASIVDQTDHLGGE